MLRLLEKEIEMKESVLLKIKETRCTAVHIS
jgi:hypothetical protein